MKKIVGIIIGIFLTSMTVLAYTIQAGISVDKIPKTLFGSWQVEAQLVETNSPSVFKPLSTDLWNLSRYGNVLKLENPFTGATAEVGLQATEGNLVIFTKNSNCENKFLKDIVSIRIENSTFSGINDVIIETHSIYDGHVIKKETARYKIKGKKLAGASLVK
ncbi:MAG: hypothetical protein ACI4S3_10470 [Candidatus Gastranaerophilaceae bacterium]